MEETWTHGGGRFFLLVTAQRQGGTATLRCLSSAPILLQSTSFEGGGGGSPGCWLGHYCKPASKSAGFSPGLFGRVMSERRCLHLGD